VTIRVHCPWLQSQLTGGSFSTRLEPVLNKTPPDVSNGVVIAVYVNLASGMKVTAIAGMIACMVTSDAEPIYMHA
jgi:hypothetical protein